MIVHLYSLCTHNYAHAQLHITTHMLNSRTATTLEPGWSKGTFTCVRLCICAGWCAHTKARLLQHSQHTAACGAQHTQTLTHTHAHRHTPTHHPHRLGPAGCRAGSPRPSPRGSCVHAPSYRHKHEHSTKHPEKNPFTF